MVLPVRVWGTDSAGKAFNALAYTLDISPSGARLCGLKVPVGVGEAVTVQYKQKRALFKVAWVGLPGDKTREQIGIHALEPERHIWIDLPQPSGFVDEFEGKRVVPSAAAASSAAKTPAMEPSAPPPLPPPQAQAEEQDDVNASLEVCTRTLVRVEELLKRQTAKAKPLHDFRDAVSKARQTAWAVQQWQELSQENPQPFPLLWYVNSERLHFVVQAMQDLWKDASEKNIEVDETLLATLFETLESLKKRYPQAAPSVDLTAESEAALAPAAASRLLEEVNDIRKRIQRSHMDMDAALNYLAAEMQRLLKAAGITIALADQGEMVCTSVFGLAPERGMVLDTDSGLGAEAMATRRLAYCRDTQKDPRVDAASCAEVGVGSVMVVPVCTDDGPPVALLEVSAQRPDAFGDKECQALESACAIVRSVLAAATGATGA